MHASNGPSRRRETTSHTHHGAVFLGARVGGASGSWSWPDERAEVEEEGVLVIVGQRRLGTGVRPFVAAGGEHARRLLDEVASVLELGARTTRRREFLDDPAHRLAEAEPGVVRILRAIELDAHAPTADSARSTTTGA
ncbi:MAG: hypothetical protein R2713_00485 [Ilumatobacteraceae bacterium]